jgi:Aspartyl protease
MDAQVVNSWKNKNKHLFFQFPEEWVAFTPELGIIEHNTDLDSLVDTLKSKGFTFKDFVMKFVHQSEVPMRPVRFLPLRIYGVRKKEWIPDYLIGLKVDQIELNESMLIDSGADISVISKKVGAILGLQVTKSEILNEVGGVGGGIIEYASRKITFMIDNIEVDAPVAWLQDDKYNELIIGREVIFDAFDIEFKQAEETIIFKKRDIS